jgi:predicted nuclease of predicted toxin-antitoxin system
VKLLFDENLSPKLVALLAAEYPGSAQVELVGLRGATDSAIWDYAQANDFILVSKDNDFRQKAFLLGAPPKVIWLAVGNSGTALVARLLKRNLEEVESFAVSADDGLLVLNLLDSI